MRFSGANLNQKFIFSRNASPISIIEVEGTSVDIAVSHSGATYNMSLAPDASGKIILDLQGILRALAPQICPIQPIYNYTYTSIADTNLINITASSSSDASISVELLAIDGGIDGDPYTNPIENDVWMTWRPEATITYRDGYELLFALIYPYAVPYPADTSSFRHRTLARVYLNTGEDVVLMLSDKTINVDEASTLLLASFNVSASRIAYLLGMVYPEYEVNDIVAYDVYGEYCTSDGVVLLTDTPAAQRFIVKPMGANVQCFMFRNRLGVPDTVYSSGSITRIVTPESATFITGRVETELTNKSSESFKVNTGPLESIDMINLWQDFFLSNERYLVGQELKKIILEEGKSEAKSLQLADMDFTYHLAEQPAGRFRKKKTLNKYRYDG